MLEGLFQTLGFAKCLFPQTIQILLEQGAQCEAVPRVIPFELHSFQQVFTYLQE